LELDEPNGFVLIQTYVDGRSLEQHLKAGRTFSQTEVEALARSLLEILIYLQEHEPPIIHRDIKPSNILLTDRSGNSPGKVYLVDFGSVQTIAAQAGSTITVVGTYGYMPPEQFGGRVSPASDLYSLGTTLIYLLTLGIGAIALLIFLPLFQRQEFTVTPTQLTWRSLLLGFKWHRVTPLSTPAITQIQLTYQTLNGVRKAVKLTIISDLQQLVLDHRWLSDVELIWLAQ
jgi:serine/threonine protein kinase